MNGSECIKPGAKLMKKAIRKEYRTLSDDERNRFHEAMRQVLLQYPLLIIVSYAWYVYVRHGVHAGVGIGWGGEGKRWVERMGMVGGWEQACQDLIWSVLLSEKFVQSDLFWPDRSN